MRRFAALVCVYVNCFYVEGTPTFGIELPISLPSLNMSLPEVPIGLPDFPISLSDVPNPLNVIFQNKCMEDLGCFYTGPPFFHPIYRPISLTPTDKKNLKTRFLLYTRENRNESQELVADEISVKNSSYDSKRDTKVLIHGYMINLDEKDIRFKIKDELLKMDDLNVIIVDWTSNNGPPYLHATANARAVAAQVALLLQYLIDNHDLNPETIHLIGHSLGCQMSGWVGERIENLGRITGLDPAGPYFHEAPNPVRLDTTDANFVDVIHTDGGENFVDGLGLGDQMGHMDFYPNGGRRQPGCFYTSQDNATRGAIVNGSTNFLSSRCDHSRANKYFLETIKTSDCIFQAVNCSSYSSFENGECSPTNSTIAVMGIQASPFPGYNNSMKFFLRTNDSEPYCIENGITL